MGKKDDDEALRVGPEGDPGRALDGARLDPRAPDQRVRTRSLSSSRSQSRSRTELINPADIQRAAATAYEAGAASARISFDTLSGAQAKALADERALSSAKDQKIEKLQGKVEELTDRILKLGSTTTKQAERELEADIEKHKATELHATLRHIATKAGPGIEPVVRGILTQFAPQLLPPAHPTTGEKSPRAAVARLIRYLQNGSEPSQHVLGMLEEMAGPEDWPLVLAFLMEQASAAGAAQEGAQPAPVH